MPGIVRVRLPGCTAGRPDRLCLERTQPDPSRTDRFRPAVRPEGPSEMNAASRPRPVAVVAPARRPDDQQRLSDLIGVIYDAAIDPSLWESAIERAAYFVGGTGGCAYLQGCRCPQRRRASISSDSRGLAGCPFQPIYPAAEPHFLGDIEQPIATTDLIPFGRTRQSELYRQWAAAPGPGRFPQRGPRQDDDQLGHIRRVPPRAKRPRR